MSEGGKEYVILDGYRVVREHEHKDGPDRGKTSALTVQGPRPQAIIPFSLIGPDTEIWHQGDRGKLQVERWKAEELGLVHARAPGRRPLPRKGEREAVIVGAILTIIRDQAKILRAAGAPGAEAMCDCGEESPEHAADPIGWHQTEFAAQELERLARRIEESCG